MMTNMREMLADLLEGEFKATYQGTREVDGTNVGVIGLAIDIESARDMSDLMEEGMDSSEMPFEVELERSSGDARVGRRRHAAAFEHRRDAGAEGREHELVLPDEVVRSGE